MLSLDDAHARVMLKKCTLQVDIKAEFRQIIAYPGLGHGPGQSGKHWSQIFTYAVGKLLPVTRREHCPPVQIPCTAC